jgi:hypothetical protein
MFVADRVLDRGLIVLTTEATHLYVCASEPSSFAAAQAARLGSRALAGGDISWPELGQPSGRQVMVARIINGAVMVKGTPTAYAVVDEPNGRLLAADLLSGADPVQAGNLFSLDAFPIGILGAA